MTALKSIVTSICCGAFLSGIIGLCLSKKGVSKAVKFLLSVFLCACVVLPVAGADFSDLTNDIPDFSEECSIDTELSSLVSSQTESIRQQAAVREIQSITEQSQVRILSISFERDGFARIVVSTCDEETKQKIEKEIYSLIGITAEVTE